MLTNPRDASGGQSSSPNMVPFDGLLLVFYSNFVCKTRRFFRYSTCKYTVTLKPWLGSLKVIENDTIRSRIHDFLLTFHNNHRPMPISYRFRDKRRFKSKIFPPVYFAPPLNTLGIGYRRKGPKTRTMRLPSRERSLTISSAVWIQSTNVTDRWTDTGRQQRPRLA